jgi:hypothetical protein
LPALAGKMPALRNIPLAVFFLMLTADVRNSQLYYQADQGYQPAVFERGKSSL